MKNKLTVFSMALFLWLLSASSTSALVAQGTAGVRVQSIPAANAIEVMPVSDSKLVVDPSTPSSDMAMPKIIPAPDNQATPNFLGQDHYYTVTFRGNGEAVVSAKMIFSNLNDQPLNSFTLTAPSTIKPENFVAYQVTKEPTCIRYAEYTPTPVPLKGTETTGMFTIPKPVQPQCLEYQQAQFYDYVWAYNAKYFKAEVTQENGAMRIALPTPIQKNETGAIVVYYNAMGYTQKSPFGPYDFNFESLKIDERIHQLQVGISTDADQILRGTQANVVYRAELSAAPMKTMALAMDNGMQNAQFDNFYGQIGQGSLTKTANDLQPMDSYKVKGSYAANTMSLYGKEIALIVFVKIVLLIALVFFIRWLLKRWKAKNGKDSKDVSLKTQIFIPALISLGVAFGSSLLVLGFTFFLFFVSSLLTNGGFISYEYMFLVSIMTGLISVGIYGILGIVPSIVMGVKKGWVWGIVTFISTIMWVGLYFIIVFIILIAFNKSNSYGGVFRPMMGVGAAPMMMKGAADEGTSFTFSEVSPR